MTNGHKIQDRVKKSCASNDSGRSDSHENLSRIPSDNEPNTEWQTLAANTTYAEDSVQEADSFKDYLNAYSLLDQDTEANSDRLNVPSKDGNSGSSNDTYEHKNMSQLETLPHQSDEISRATNQNCNESDSKCEDSVDVDKSEQESMALTNTNEVLLTGTSDYIESSQVDPIKPNLIIEREVENEVNEDGDRDEDENDEDNEEGDDNSNAGISNGNPSEEDEGGYNDGGDIYGDTERQTRVHNSSLLRELIQQSANGGGESNLLNAMQRLVGGFENSFLGSQISEFDTLIANLGQLDDPYLMLETVSEISERLLMMDGMTAERVVSSNKLSMALIGILKDPSLEDDLELHLVTCRCLFNFIEVNSDFINDALNNGAVQVLASKLLNIIYIDLTEQCLQTLEIISQERESHNLIIACDGLRSCLQNLDFLTIHSQRKCMKIVANSCTDIKYSQFNLIKSQFNEIYRVARDHCDMVVKELAWLAISRIVGCFGKKPEDLEKLFLQEDILRQLLNVIQESCNSDHSGSRLDNHSRSCLLKSLVTLISGSVNISSLLLDLDIGEFVRASLSDFEKSTECSESLSPSKCLSLEALISCPKDVLSHFLEVIAYLLPVAYPVQESPFLARKECQKKKDLNELRVKLLSNDQLESLLTFIGKVWPVLVLAFQATIDFGVRKRTLICFTRIVFVCQTQDLHNIEDFRSLLTIFSSVLSGGSKALKGSGLGVLDAINGGPARSQALLIYGTCIIMKELIRKAEFEYSESLFKEGVFDDLTRIREILTVSCERSIEKQPTDDTRNDSSECWEYSDCFTSLREQDFSDGELTDLSNHLTKKPITKRLLSLIKDIESFHERLTGNNMSVHLLKINKISTLLEEASTKDESIDFDWESVWEQLITLLQEDEDKVSSYELLSSGIIKQLSGLLSPDSNKSNVPVLTFIKSFYEHYSALVHFIMLLHDSLSRSELFEVISSGRNTRNGVSEYTSQLTKQVKINLEFGIGIEKQENLPKSILLSVHSIATFESVDAYVKNTYFSDIYTVEKGFDFSGTSELTNDLTSKLGRIESNFSICGRKVSKDSTLFGAIYDSLKSGQSSNRIGAQDLWSKTHHVEYAVGTFTSNPSVPSESPLDSENMESHSRYTLDLLKSLHSLNSKAGELCRGRIIPIENFMNWKLTVKVNKQLDEPLIIASGCMPSWTFHVVREYSFLFPLGTRMHFMQSTSFGLSRLVHSLQVRAAREQNIVADSSNLGYGQLGMPLRKKARISREKLLHSAIRVLMEYGADPGILEIEYFEEVGSGLGPTLEFYANVSHEFSKSSLRMWTQSDDDEEYVFATKGLFPSAITRHSPIPEKKKLLLLFHVLGIFVARSLIDSRILDLHFNTVFISLLQNPDTIKSVIVNEDITAMLELLGQVDEKLATSLTHLTRYFPHINDDDNDEMVQIDGMTVSDLCLTFVLPGSGNLPLVDNGSEIAVTTKNLLSYVKQVLVVKLFYGIDYQIQAFREGFSLVFPIDSLMCFSPIELAQLFGNAEEDWSEETITRAIKANHGYSKNSAAVKNLVAIMSHFSHEERRCFLQFLTGSPRLPVGGFQSIKPEFTVVEKHPEPGQSSDDYLPSVMTCANFLKLPNYSSQDIMKSRICHAMKEGAGSFHLS